MSNEEHEIPNTAAVTGAVERARSKAAEYLRDPEKSKQLLDEALKKAKKKEKNQGPLADIWNNLKALLRMMQAYIRREYVDIPWVSIVTVVGAIIYFLSPFDLIPDFLPFAGYIDDAAVIAFILAQVKVDLDNYLQWEVERSKQDESL
jgi:uncharacterized membrane protein YkvA (DUF1232 family)